jgi:hypothetical protein
MSAKQRPTGDGAETTIPNERLTLRDVPSEGASWYDISDFALSYNGYAEAGSFERCAEIANARRNDSLDDLRACLSSSSGGFGTQAGPPRARILSTSGDW